LYILQRHRVIGVNRKHRVRSNLAGAVQRGGIVGEQRCVELQGVLAGLKIVDRVITRAWPDRERGTSRIAKERCVGGAGDQRVVAVKGIPRGRDVAEVLACEPAGVVGIPQDGVTGRVVAPEDAVVTDAVEIADALED
jgi:hypothetical protein